MATVVHDNTFIEEILMVDVDRPTNLLEEQRQGIMNFHFHISFCLKIAVLDLRLF